MTLSVHSVYPFSPVLLRQYLYLNLGLVLSQLNWNSDTHTDPPVSASLQSWGYRFVGCPVYYVGAGIQNPDLRNHVTSALNLGAIPTPTELMHSLVIVYQPVNAV